MAEDKNMLVASLINAATTSTQIELQAMLIDNADREDKGSAKAYGESTFLNLQMKFEERVSELLKILEGVDE